MLVDIRSPPRSIASLMLSPTAPDAPKVPSRAASPALAPPESSALQKRGSILRDGPILEMLLEPPPGIEKLGVDAATRARVHASRTESPRVVHDDGAAYGADDPSRRLFSSLNPPTGLLSPIARRASAGSPLAPNATPLPAERTPNLEPVVGASDAAPDLRARDEYLVSPKEEMEAAAEMERLLFGREEKAAKTPRPTTPATPGTRALETPAFTAERPRLSMTDLHGAVPPLEGDSTAARGSPLMAEVAPPAPPAGVRRRETRDASITPPSPPAPKKKRPLAGAGAGAAKKGRAPGGAPTPKRKLEGNDLSMFDVGAKVRRGGAAGEIVAVEGARRVVKTGAGTYDSCAADELSADAKRAKTGDA